MAAEAKRSSTHVWPVACPLGPAAEFTGLVCHHAGDDGEEPSRALGDETFSLAIPFFLVLEAFGRGMSV